MATNPNTIPTRLVHTQGPVSVPTEYDVPGSQEIQLASVTAEFNGSGASGSYFPTLSVYSQDGQLLGRTHPQVTILAAGDDAVVTWLPFSRAAPSAAPASATYAQFIDAQNIFGQTIPSGASTAVTFDVGHAVGGAFDYTGGSPNQPFVFHDGGTLEVSAYVTWAAFAGDRYIEINIVAGGGSNYPFNPVRSPATGTPAGATQAVNTNASVGSGDHNITLNVFQSSGVNRAITGAGMHAVWIPTVDSH